MHKRWGKSGKKKKKKEKCDQKKENKNRGIKVRLGRRTA